jgi:hypothetical protein
MESISQPVTRFVGFIILTATGLVLTAYSH